MTLFAGQRYALGRAFAMLRDRPTAFLLSVVLTASALALPLALASLLWAARPTLSQIQPSPEISVFVSTRASPRDLDSLRARLAAMPGVADVSVRPKEVALAQLIKKSGFTTSPAEFGVNPLPDVLVAQLAMPGSADAVASLGRSIRDWPLVDAVRSDLDWYRKLKALGDLALTAIVLFGGLVTLLIALILLGTVRLHAGTRADEVAVLRLVGATPRFIVRPYAYSAALTLLVASVLAIGMVGAAHVALRLPLARLSQLYGVAFDLPGPEPAHMAAVLVGAAIFGWLIGLVGARIAIAAR